MRMKTLVLAAVFAVLSSGVASAQERITLAEIVPALTGTELGALDLGAAPAPGLARVVTRADVLAALSAAGRTANGLRIPRSVRIERVARRMSKDEVATLAMATLNEAVAPCTAGNVHVLDDVTVPASELQVDVDAPARPVSGHAVVTIVLRSGSTVVRAPAQIALVCPAPVVSPGDDVRVVVALANVRASSDGRARQSGRVGDMVRVRVASTGAEVTGRVVDAHTVEVRP